MTEHMSEAEGERRLQWATSFAGRHVPLGDVEDVASAICVEILASWEKVSDLDPSERAYYEIGIGRHVVARYWTRTYRWQDLLDRLAARTGPATGEPAEMAGLRASALAELRSHLSERQEEVFRMRFAGFTTGAIADELGVSMTTIKAEISRIALMARDLDLEL